MAAITRAAGAAMHGAKAMPAARAPALPGTGSLTASGPCLADLAAVVNQIRAMVQYVQDAREAVISVRRAKAADALVEEALKGYRMLTEAQFELKQDAAE